MNDMHALANKIDTRALNLSEDLTRKFVFELRKFCDLVNSQKRKIRSHSADSIARFEAKSVDQKNRIVEDFLAFAQPFQEHAVEKDLFKSEPELLKKIMFSLGAMIDSQAYYEITDGDIIEIYNADFKQVFRNLEFMYVCSYTLMDLLAHEPFELYERSQQINTYIFEAAGQLLNRGFNLSPISLEHIPKHLIREKFSEENLTSLVELKRAYPLYKWPRTIYGWLVIQRGESVKEPPKDVVFM